MKDSKPPLPQRRAVLALGAALAGSVIVRPATAQSDELATALAAYAGGAVVRPGRVRLEVAKLVDNGNVVPVSVSVESPMTAADHVVGIAIFNEKNPQREVAKFTLGPRAGKASASTRIRLATSQKLVAVARLSDGSVWSDTVDVIVVLAACIEGDG
ncbi:MAG: SoxY-related arm protein [Ramlibacter sp.]|nr:SoxY-related arm protein [Ramlibacter sp.]